MRCVVRLTLLFAVGVLMGLSGCGKAAPPTPSSPIGAAGAGAVGQPTPPAGGQATPAATGGAGSVTTGSGVDQAIQQKLLAQGTKPAAESASSGPTRNDLKQVGLAFHNFHDSFNGFPSPNGTMIEGDKKPDISWRVRLLPFVDQYDLYQQFHLDEPWDSPHNKTLITKMPAVYGHDPEGKTRLHVLTGAGAPFQNDKLTKLRDITDGTSNTIMAFVGGPDTAEIWTKPGGREFNSANPAQALGNSDPQFMAVMMDGAVRKLPKTLAAKDLAAIFQAAEGTIPNLDNTSDGSVAGAAGKPAQPIKINDPVTPLTPALQKIDTAFIPADAFLVAAIHPRRIYSHPFFKALRDVAPPEAVDGMVNEMSGGAPISLRDMKGLREQLGLAVENLDEVILVLDSSVPAAASAPTGGPPPFGVVVRNSAPLDIDGIIAQVKQNVGELAVVQHEGVTLVLGPQQDAVSGSVVRPSVPPPVAPPTAPNFSDKAAPKEDPCQVEPPGAGDLAPMGLVRPPRFAVAFINSSTLVAGAETVVKKMISARVPSPTAAPITKQLESLGNPLAGVAINLAPVEKPLRELLNGAPPFIALFSPYVLGTQEVKLTWDLDANEFLNVSAKFKTPELAGGLFAMLDGQWQGLKQQYTASRAQITQFPTGASLVSYSDQVINESKLAHSGTDLTFVIPKIKDLEKLPAALKPGFEGANRAALATQHKNNMKQIGLALFNYAETFKYFPALNGSGDPSKPGPGLSWRVYILPYIDHAALYSQFNFEEAWDSPHNKALIPQMPKLFGTNPEGKTSIHAFAGKGAAFQNDKGFTFADYKDGSSNSLIIVEAGQDTADYWTKPGGLTIDPADPLKCLGNIQDLFGLLGDGSVRNLKGIDGENLQRAVNIADGQPVNFPE